MIMARSGSVTPPLGDRVRDVSDYKSFQSTALELSNCSPESVDTLEYLDAR